MREWMFFGANKGLLRMNAYYDSIFIDIFYFRRRLLPWVSVLDFSVDARFLHDNGFGPLALPLRR